MKIAVLHTKIKMGAKRTNARRLGILIDRILSSINSTIDMVVLPSYPFTGPIVGYYSPSKVPSKLREFAEKIAVRSGTVGPTVGYMIKWSREYGVYIAGGPIVERAGPRLYLTSVIIAPDGSIAGKYRKVNLTREEIEAGISYGREPGIFNADGGRIKIGVFIDEDLALPELFRAMQLHKVNIIIGKMMPYNSEHLGKIVEYRERAITMETSMISTFLVARAREIGVPIILVGGILDGGNSNSIAFMSTIPVDPDEGIIESNIYGLDEEDAHMVVEISREHSISKPIPEAALRFFKNMICKTKRSSPSFFAEI